MENSQRIKDALQLQQQLERIKPEYYRLWDNIDDMRVKQRTHLSTMVAAFLGVITSLHENSNNICKEWLYFSSVILCVLSLLFFISSSFENLHNSIRLRDNIKKTLDKSVDTMTPIDNISFATPKQQVYSVLFWLGISFFSISIIIICLINIPIW